MNNYSSYLVFVLICLTYTSNANCQNDTLVLRSKSTQSIDYRSEGYILTLYNDSTYFFSITCGYEECAIAGFSMGTYYFQNEHIILKDLNNENAKVFEKLANKLKFNEFMIINERYVFNFRLSDKVGDSLTGKYLNDSIIIIPSIYHYKNQWGCNTNTPLFNDIYDLGYNIVSKPFSKDNNVGVVDILLWDSNEDSIYCKVSGIITNVFQHDDSYYTIDIFNGCGMSHLRTLYDFNLNLEEGDYIEKGTFIGFNKSRRFLYYLRAVGLIKIKN